MVANVKEEGGVGEKYTWLQGAARGVQVAMEMLCTLMVSVDILVVVLYYPLA